jgi:chromosome segregation protein
MRLNHLEIAGFKSFAERAALAFDDGVTAIVGPNGCGKSNVIDAITWVLGEQSARSLRGERMEDVIFGGSDARRPTAAAEVRIQLSEVTAALANAGNGLPVASTRVRSSNGNGNRHGGATRHGNGNRHDASPVSAGPSSPSPASMVSAPAPGRLHLDDGDDADLAEPTVSRDVEVARRLFRSGESEYLIDGRVCRLREIQDLLMDSGLGVKAYAVIEQGRIGQILGARPAERRQLLEEAAGVTKYKARRRTAELKLEAAQQNLTRVDDIVFEVEKQRGALKRQAAKARRYRRLRDELRRWQKVHFARRNRLLEGAIETATRLLEEARAGERGAAAALAALESGRERLRLELTETDGAATALRETAHAREIDVERHQQQIEFGKRRAAELATALEQGTATLGSLTARCGPVAEELEAQREAHRRCVVDRDATHDRLRDAERAFGEGQRAIEGREGDVEAARSEMFAAVNAATALQNVIDNAVSAHRRIAESLSKTDAEVADLAAESDRIGREHTTVEAARGQGGERLEAVHAGRTECTAELASAHAAVESRIRDLRAREQQVAVMRARAESLEELEAGRAAYGEAARQILAAGSQVSHHGSVADHLDVERGDEPAVESCLADVLQDVVVPSRRDALAGVALAASRDIGRCGFLVADETPARNAGGPPHPALRALTDVVRVSGAGAAAVRRLLQRRWVAPSIEEAAAAAATTEDPIATPEGVVVRGGDRLAGGGCRGAAGFLGPKREIKELRERLGAESAAVERLGGEIAAHEAEAGRIGRALGALQDEEHALEKQLVGLDMQLTRLDDERTRVAERQRLVETERGQLLEERGALEAREAEAREAIARLEGEQREADDRFMEAERRLHDAREVVESLGRDTAGARARHATMSERTAALASDVRRLDDQANELRERIARCEADNERAHADRCRALEEVARSAQQLDADVETFDALRREIVTVDERVAGLRQRIAGRDDEVRASRQTLERARAEVSRQEVSLATADADLVHLTESCMASLQASLEDVRREVDGLEADGPLEPDRALVGASSPAADASGDDESLAGGDEPEESAAGEAVVRADVVSEEPGCDQAPEAQPVDADALVDLLRAKVERLGAVNMMAIDQFDELEERHAFLTTQRQDLIDSISTTGDAIKRIDATTRSRFQDAFTAVNEHFQLTFETLFGGGRAELVLLDETDVLESGIDIAAQPPGKRLQSIQLLSGGEKALTAMALMFAIFKYRPSPFCLLDEIDAPLDDVNIGRFVDMLRGLQDRTQFVLVTHNRKTMEIADRLYGITMEEPGVSKLISVNMAQ